MARNLRSSLAVFLPYLWSAAACAVTALLAAPLREVFDLANIVMLFLLAVVLVAVRLGRGPAVAASFLSVALFDFFYVPPRFSWAVADAQYLVTFAVMLTVALLIGHLTAGLRQRAVEYQNRERRIRALYEMTRELAGAITLDQVAESIRRFLADEADLVSLLLVGGQTEVPSVLGAESGRWLNLPLARSVIELAEPVKADVLPEDGAACLYVPLSAPTSVRGALAVMGRQADRLDELRPLLDTVASLAAIAVERLHYAEVARATEVGMMAERLRSSILSALSHDLRTPLTALVGLADSLSRAQPPLPERQADTAMALREQGLRLSRLVANLLDMARLQAGEVRLRKEWQPVEEVIGASIKLLEPSLAGHPVHVAQAAGLPLLAFDAVLIERVFCNLIENAAKYAPAGTPIDIGATVVDGAARLSVCDRGPGIPAARRTQVFDLFMRGNAESAIPGVGLGLAICRTIVEAHGGTISVTDRPAGGSCFVFTLPLGEPPAVEADDD